MQAAVVNSSIFRIEGGHRGVIFNRFKGVEMEVLKE
jgi:hypothetical protein